MPLQRGSTWLHRADPFMAIASTLFVVAFLAVVLAKLDAVANFRETTQSYVARHFSGYLVWVVTIIMTFTVLVACPNIS